MMSPVSLLVKNVEGEESGDSGHSGDSGDSVTFSTPEQTGLESRFAAKVTESVHNWSQGVLSVHSWSFLVIPGQKVTT